MGLIWQGLLKFFCLVKVDSEAKEHSNLGEFVQHQLQIIAFVCQECIVISKEVCLNDCIEALHSCIQALKVKEKGIQLVSDVHSHLQTLDGIWQHTNKKNSMYNSSCNSIYFCRELSLSNFRVSGGIQLHTLFIYIYYITQQLTFTSPGLKSSLFITIIVAKNIFYETLSSLHTELSFPLPLISGIHALWKKNVACSYKLWL